MATIVTRAGKGSPLTNAEMDTNLTNLNSDKAKAGANSDITSLSALSAGGLPDNSVLTADIADAQITAAKLATAVLPLGVGQTWQDVTSTRALSTTYTNSTGRPIAASIFGTCNQDNSFVLTVGGITLNGSAAYATVKGTYVAGIIPPGATYSVATTGGTLINWCELR